MTTAEQLRARLLGFRPTDVFWGWAGPIIFAVLGGILRFWSLGRPHQLVFDETYYVKQGVSMIEYGVEMRWKDVGEKVDPLFTAGNLNVFNTTEGDMVVHPPVGKWVIGFGEWLFGSTSSFGWRFSVALLGTISIVMVGRVARRLFGSSLLGALASFLLAFEGHHFVQSRTGLLDLIVMFFAFGGFAALLLDRDRSRAILADKLAALPAGTRLAYGPWLGWRPWRWVAGLSLGLSTGTKWSGIYFLAAFGIMTVLWDMGARRAVGVRHWMVGAAAKDGLFAFVAMVGTAAATYLVSWTGWFLSPYGYDRQWGAQHPSAHYAWVPNALRSLWKYTQEAYAFNINLSSSHPYMSNPWSWMIQGRPTSFFYEGPKKGQDGCMVDQCSKAIASMGSVTVWWLATAGIFILLFYWFFRRDWRAGAVLAGYVGGYLPWFLYQGRTIFTFYAVAFEPWVILTCVFVLGLVLGPVTASWRRRRIGLAVIGAYCLLHLAVFAFFWPVWTAQVIPYEQWRLRMWFPSWI